METSRRDFLGTAAKAFLGLALATPAVAVARVGLPITPNLVDTADGTFVFLGGTHGYGPIGQAITRDSVAGIRNIRAAFVESGVAKYFRNGTRELLGKPSFENLVFYREIIPHFEETGVKLLFGDMPQTQSVTIPVDLTEELPSIAAVVSGLNLLFGESQANLDRREFFMRPLGALLSLWAGARFSERLLAVLSEPARQKELSWLRDAALLTEVSHPEDMLATFRNALIAEKLLNYAQEITNGYDKPTIAIMMGSGHEFISEYLKRGRTFCQNVLGLYPNGILEIIFGDDFENYYSALAEITTVGEGITTRIIIDRALESKISTRETKGYRNLERWG